MVYYSVYFLLIILSSIEVISNKIRNNRFFYLLPTIILVLLAGLRYHTGYDYLSYQNIYESINNFNDIFKLNIEIGFLFINWGLKFIIDNFQVFIFVVAFFSVILKSKFLKKYSEYAVIPLLYYFSFYFLVRDMGQMRQALSVGILIWSIPYIYKRDFWKFLSIVLLASSIHFTSIIFLICYFFNKIKLNIPKIIILILLSLLFSIIDLKIILEYLFENIFNFLPYSHKIPNYINNKPDEVARIGFSLKVIWRLFILTISLLFYNRLIKFKYFETYFKIYFIGSVIFFSFNSVSIFAGRLTDSFFFIEGIILSYIIVLFKYKEIKIILLIVLALISFVRLNGFVVRPEYINYITIFVN